MTPNDLAAEKAGQAQPQRGTVITAAALAAYARRFIPAPGEFIGHRRVPRLASPTRIGAPKMEGERLRKTLASCPPKQYRKAIAS
jgi:hypothetical protein